MRRFDRAIARVMVKSTLSDLDHEEKEPLICADLRTEGCVNQRFLLLRKTNRTKKQLRIFQRVNRLRQIPASCKYSAFRFRYFSLTRGINPDRRRSWRDDKDAKRDLPRM